MAVADDYGFHMADRYWRNDRAALVQCPRRAHSAEYIACERWIMIFNEDRREVEVESCFLVDARDLEAAPHSQATLSVART